MLSGCNAEALSQMLFCRGVWVCAGGLDASVPRLFLCLHFVVLLTRNCLG